jgi:hypothetical protein
MTRNIKITWPRVTYTSPLSLQQARDADKLYGDLIDYAKSIGCIVIHDEIEANEEQARNIASWWMDREGS